MASRIGVVEILVSCVIGLLSLGLPVAMLVLLFMIYGKLKSIEDLLQKDR